MSEKELNEEGTEKGKLELRYFDTRLISLMAEVRAHPDLIEKINKAEENGRNFHSTIFQTAENPDMDVIRTAEEGLGFIAAYVGIMLEGDYLMEDLLNCCDAIRERLEERRTIYINSTKAEKPDVI
jgi:hypothetical protein